jgi:hypothetical protein
MDTIQRTSFSLAPPPWVMPYSIISHSGLRLDDVVASASQYAKDRMYF